MLVQYQVYQIIRHLKLSFACEIVSGCVKCQSDIRFVIKRAVKGV